jgi:hypothetical protein
LGFVERDVGDVFLRGGEVDGGLGGWVVAPGDYGVEVGDDVLRETCGESLAVELGGEAGGEVLKHDETDEETVAWGPGCGLVPEEAELEWKMGALKFHRSVDSGRVSLEEAELIGGKGCDGAVGGGADEEGALETVVSEEGRTENFSEGARGVAAEGVHLPEAVLSSDETLGEKEIVERGGADVGDAVGVALDGDGSGEAGDGDGAVELGKGVAHGLAEPVAGGDEADDSEQDDERGEDDCDVAEDAAAFCLESRLLWSERLVGNYVGVGEVGETHGSHRQCKWWGGAVKSAVVRFNGVEAVWLKCSANRDSKTTDPHPSSLREGSSGMTARKAQFRRDVGGFDGYG